MVFLRTQIFVGSKMMFCRDSVCARGIVGEDEGDAAFLVDPEN